MEHNIMNNCCIYNKTGCFIKNIIIINIMNVHYHMYNVKSVCEINLVYVYSDYTSFLTDCFITICY